MIALALGLFGGLWAGSAIVRDFEAAAAREIKSQLKGESKVSVNARVVGLGLDAHMGTVTIKASGFQTEGLPLYTEPDRSQYGRVDRLKLDLSNFDLRGLRVEKLEALIPGCRYDHGLAASRKQFRLSRSGEGTGSVRVRQSELEKFVLKKYREIKEVKVQFKDGRALIEGYGEFLLIATRFRVDARLATSDGRKIDLADARIEFDGKAADPASADALLQTLNPVIDLDRDLRLDGAITVRELDLRDGVLKASGTCRIPVRPGTLPIKK